MYEPAAVDAQTFVVTHVLNNNAVIVRSDAGISVFVGKGIGFGRKPEDCVTMGEAQEHYVAVEPDKLHHFNMLTSLPPEVLSAIAGGVEKASEMLGQLHPSVYLLLTDHLVFAVERFRDGQMIQNNLVPEIRAVFPAEFAAARQVLAHVNQELDVELPLDEAAFIALHLNAALSGDTVKAPLSRANALAELTDGVLRSLHVEHCSRSARELLTTELVALVSRLSAGRARSCAVHRSIARDIPDEWLQAERIMAALLCETMGEVPTLNAEQREGETAFLAVFLHGWKQDVSPNHSITQRGSSK